MAKREGFFQHDGVRYRFAVWESEAAEAAPVVLLHGFAQSAASWDNVAEFLGRTRSVVALDLVGHGGSDRPEGADAYALGAQGEMLLAYLASRGWRCWPSPRQEGQTERFRIGLTHGSRKPLVVGYSMGGRVALAAASRSAGNVRPFCVGGLVLESAGLGPVDEHEREGRCRARCAQRRSPAPRRALGVHGCLGAPGPVRHPARPACLGPRTHACQSSGERRRSPRPHVRACWPARHARARGRPCSCSPRCASAARRCGISLARAT